MIIIIIFIIIMLLLSFLLLRLLSLWSSYLFLFVSALVVVHTAIDVLLDMYTSAIVNIENWGPNKHPWVILPPSLSHGYLHMYKSCLYVDVCQ